MTADLTPQDHAPVQTTPASLPPPVPKSDLPVRSHAVASHDRAEFGEIDLSENSIDGMGAINFTDEEDCGFFGMHSHIFDNVLWQVLDLTNGKILGPSSNIALLRHISQAIARGSTHGARSLSVLSPNHTGGGMLNVSRSRPSPDESGGKMQASKNGINVFALPSEERTWSLIQAYFEKTGQLLPFIHEASFCETYFRMREDNFKRVRRTWLGLLNVVLAIATSLHTESDLPAGKRIQESDIYFQRANGLCDKDSKRNASLEMGRRFPSSLNLDHYSRWQCNIC